MSTSPKSKGPASAATDPDHGSHPNGDQEMNAYTPIMPATGVPVHALDFNNVEIALARARNIACIVHKLLDVIAPMPREVTNGAPGILLFTEDDRDQLCFAAHQTVLTIKEAEQLLDDQLGRLSPAAGQS